jgi:hypothetical protein
LAEGDIEVTFGACFAIKPVLWLERDVALGLEASVLVFPLGTGIRDFWAWELTTVGLFTGLLLLICPRLTTDSLGVFVSPKVPVEVANDSVDCTVEDVSGVG